MEAPFQIAPPMRRMLQLVLTLSRLLLFMGVAYLAIATAAMLLADAMPEAFGPAGRSLADAMDEHGFKLVGVLALLGLEAWLCSWLLRTAPAEPVA